MSTFIIIIICVIIAIIFFVIGFCYGLRCMGNRIINNLFDAEKKGVIRLGTLNRLADVLFK